MENLGKTEVRRGPTTSSSHFIICWVWFVAVAVVRDVKKSLHASGGFSTWSGVRPPLSYLFRSWRRQPILALVETGLPAASGQRARWVFARR